MSAGEPRAAFGTVYHPQPELATNGGSQPAPGGKLLGLPRRRRPGMIALAVALVGAGILASAALYQREDHRVPALLVTAAVPAGSVITAADIGTTSVAAGPGLRVIPASQLRQVVGLVAATSLQPGSLLAPSELTTVVPPARGQVLVPVPVRPSGLPASGLGPGDQVLVVPTSGSPGQSGGQSGAQSAPAVLTHPLPAVVEAVSRATNQDGYDVVDLLVAAGSGPVLAQQAATGDIALTITKRNP